VKIRIAILVEFKLTHMKSGKYVFFSQLIEFLPARVFDWIG